MKTIIAGGRDYQMTAEDLRFLDTLTITEVVCGGATGADEGGRDWAVWKGIPVKHFPADWPRHGRAAGPIRNRQMAEYADQLVIFPGGRGSANMLKTARELGLAIYSPLVPDPVTLLAIAVATISGNSAGTPDDPATD